MAHLTERADIAVGPLPEAPLEQEPEAFAASAERIVGAHRIASMLPIKEPRFQIVVDGATCATDKLIGPPVMRNDILVRAGRAQQFSRRMVHDHGVAAANAL